MGRWGGVRAKNSRGWCQIWNVTATVWDPARYDMGSCQVWYGIVPCMIWCHVWYGIVPGMVRDHVKNGMGSYLVSEHMYGME